MSLHLPLRPLARSTRAFPISLAPRRTLFNFFRKRSGHREPLDPLSEDFKAKRKAKLPASQQTATPGSIKDSIFDEDSPGTKPPSGPSTAIVPSAAAAEPLTLARRDKSLMAAAIDPQPSVRRRWERNMVIREVQRRGRITRAVKIARTERQHLLKSPMLYTSVKKLMPLARQIAGKSVEDAIVQMRFSKKRVARDVLKYLRLARDEAVVARGMGLGAVKGEGEGEGNDGEGKKEKEVYLDKKGRKRVVEDSTGMYIDQAWVGRGSYGREVEFRARGRTNILRPPHTSITFLLKEEATRIREAKDREEKRARKKPWVHHPDRPITAQRQYVLW